MEKPTSAGSPKQQNKAKKKQIKVVYITNPMRVKTTAAEFKGLVQELFFRSELTGQDSDIAERLTSSTFEEEMETAPADRGSVSSDGSLAGPPGSSGGNGEIQQQQQQQRVPSEDKGTGTPYDLLDEDFPAQILEDFDSFMPSSSYYEFSPAIDDSKKNLDTA